MECAGLVTAKDVIAGVNSPSTDVSMKDGYAIRTADARKATRKTPVDLKLCGMLGAGEATEMTVKPGTTLRILTGARIPVGADAVIAEEFVSISNGSVRVLEPEVIGRNILSKGSDVARGDLIVAAGTFLTPGKVGLLAAGGIADIQIICRPSVALIASGDEIMLPGSVPCEGKIYASNLLTPAFASNLENLMDGDRAVLWVHGHMHESFDYDIYGARVVCNPRGYAPKALNPDFRSNWVVDI